MYTFLKRTVTPASLATFDAPDREKCTARRALTNTPLQALNLLNDPVFVEAAEALAYRLQTEAPADFRSRLRYAFEISLARPPEPAEVDRLAALFEKQTAVKKQEPGSADPWVVLGSVLLNLDEFVTRE